MYLDIAFDKENENTDSGLANQSVEMRFRCCVSGSACAQTPDIPIGAPGDRGTHTVWHQAQAMAANKVDGDVFIIS